MNYGRIFYSLHNLLMGTVPKGVPKALWDQLGWQKDLLRITGGLMTSIVVLGIVGSCSARTVTFALIGDNGFGIMGGLFAVHGTVVFFGVRSALRRLSRALVRAQWRICMQCGYSLSGLPSPHKCPECGIVYTWDGLRTQWTQWLSRHGLDQSALEPGSGAG